MPEVTIRRTGELLRRLFEILLAEPEGLTARDALARLASSVTLTEYEKGDYQSGRRFEKIVRFATVECVKAGWLIKNKGTWSVTAAGEKAYRAFSDPEAFHKEAFRLYREWAGSRPGATEQIGAQIASESDESEKAVGITFEQAEEQAWAEIEEYLRGVNPYEFQKLVADLLKAMGYHVAWIAPPGKDGGIDILAHGDPLGTRAPRIKVQVKRVAQKVSSELLRAFMELIGEGDVGLYVSTAGFTKDAEDYARTRENRRITLIDLERLVDLWVQFEKQLDDAARQRLPLSPIYFLSPKT